MSRRRPRARYVWPAAPKGRRLCTSPRLGETGSEGVWVISTKDRSAVSLRGRAAFERDSVHSPSCLVRRIQGPLSGRNDARRRGCGLPRRSGARGIARPSSPGRSRLFDRKHALDHPSDAGRLLALAPTRCQRRRTDLKRKPKPNACASSFPARIMAAGLRFLNNCRSPCAVSVSARCAFRSA